MLPSEWGLLFGPESGWEKVVAFIGPGLQDVQKLVHEDVSRVNAPNLRPEVRISSLKNLIIFAQAATKWLAGGRLPSTDVWMSSRRRSSMKMASWYENMEGSAMHTQATVLKKARPRS